MEGVKCYPVRPALQMTVLSDRSRSGSVFAALERCAAYERKPKHGWVSLRSGWKEPDVVVDARCATLGSLWKPCKSWSARVLSPRSRMAMIAPHGNTSHSEVQGACRFIHLCPPKDFALCTF